MNNIKNYPLISVVIPCYKTEDFLDKCLESITQQTYRELEIICVNDCSGEAMEAKLSEWATKDDRIKIVANEENIGLFHSRIKGARVATGKFLTFVDSDDWLSRDYIRMLFFESQKSKADIVLANLCTVTQGGNFAMTDFNQARMLSYGENFFASYINTTGAYYRWHTAWGKLISAELWQGALPQLEQIKDRFMMCEDVVFSTALLAKAQRVSFADDCFYYYNKTNENCSTAANKSLDGIVRRLNDIATAFSWTERIVKSLRPEHDYSAKLTEWRNYYIDIWLRIARQKAEEAYESMLAHVKKTHADYKPSDMEALDAGGQTIAPLSDEMDEAVKKIQAADVVSFDIFDTLIMRPFYAPSDLFELLDFEATKLVKTRGMARFSTIRKEAESILREENWTEETQDIRFEQIYDTIHEKYHYPKAACDKLAAREIELEKQMCYTRQYGKNLYELAHYLKKTVIITSDMYLPREVIEAILKKNGYDCYDRFYLSCDAGKTKHIGDLYRCVAQDYEGKTVVHVDDNYENVENAQNILGSAIHLPRSIDIYNHYPGRFLADCADPLHANQYYCGYSGVRAAIALAANKLFDNPFLAKSTDCGFNASAHTIGYLALGPHTLALAKWILDSAEHESLDSLAFLARDGYLPMLATKLIQEKTQRAEQLKINYLYTSRRATLPIALTNDADFQSISDYIEWQYVTPAEIFKQLQPIIADETAQNAFLKKYYYGAEQKFKNYREFRQFVERIQNELYDDERYAQNYAIAKQYHEELLPGNCGVFDIGYSGKPEVLISELVDKSVHTYFVHGTFQKTYYYDKIAQNHLHLFFDFHPKVTGTIRELFFSSTEGSCRGYERAKDGVKPILSTAKMLSDYHCSSLELTQQAAMDFICDYLEFFGDYLDCLDLNPYYMSYPLEHYFGDCEARDLAPYGDIDFDDAPGKIRKLSEVIMECRGIHGDEQDEAIESYFERQFVPQKRLPRMLYYMLFNRKMLRKKVGTKVDDMAESPKRHRRVAYYALRDHNKLQQKIQKKIKR